MAVKYQDLHDKLSKTDFNDYERSLIDDAE